MRSKGQRKAETKEDIYDICVCMYVYTHTYGVHTYICETEARLLKGRNSKRWRRGEERNEWGSNKNKMTDT